MSLLVCTTCNMLMSLVRPKRSVTPEADCESLVHPAIGGIPASRYADTRGLAEMDTAGLSVTVRPTTRHTARPTGTFPGYLGLWIEISSWQQENSCTRGKFHNLQIGKMVHWWCSEHLERHKILKAAVRVHKEFRQRASLSNTAIDTGKTSLLGPAVLRLPSDLV